MKVVSCLFIILALFLAPSAFAEEQERTTKKTTLHGLIASGAVHAAQGVAFVAVTGAKASAGAAEVVADRSVASAKAVAEAASGIPHTAWSASRRTGAFLAHTTPAQYGGYIADGGTEVGRQAARTPSRAWRGFKWVIAHI